MLSQPISNYPPPAVPKFLKLLQHNIFHGSSEQGLVHVLCHHDLHRSPTAATPFDPEIVLFQVQSVLVGILRQADFEIHRQ